MKNRIYLLGFFCILLCVLFSVPAYANELSQNLETESVSEIVTTSTATISPADNFLKIGESQRYTCIVYENVDFSILVLNLCKSSPDRLTAV